MRTLTSVACAVVLAALCAGMPANPEPDIWFSTSVYPYGAPSSRRRRQSEEPLNATHVPESVCVSMSPSHNDSEPQDSSAPFKVYVDKHRVAADGNLTVTLWSKDNTSFRGIYIQARSVGNVSAIGTFLPNNYYSSVVISDCPPGTDNALSYVNRTGLSKLELKWRAPDEIGEFRFWCTFVKDFSTFWVGVKSHKIRIVSE